MHCNTQRHRNNINPTTLQCYAARRMRRTTSRYLNQHPEAHESLNIMNQLDTMDQHDTDQKMDAPDYEEDIAEKGPIEANVAALSGEGLVKSRLDQMSILQSAWVYKRAFFFCFMVYTSSIMEYFMASRVWILPTLDYHVRVHHRQQRIHRAVWQPAT